MKGRHSDQRLVPRPLTIEECRKLMGWHDLSDKEIAEFLAGLRVFNDRVLDEYFKDEFSDDEE